MPLDCDQRPPPGFSQQEVWNLVISAVLGLIIGSMIAFAGLIKFREGSRKLAESINAYRFIPPALTPTVAAFLPPLEVAIGICLITMAPGPWAWFAASLLVVYTAAVVSVIRRGISTDCGCFGSVLKTQASTTVVARNIVFLLMIVPACVQSLSTLGGVWYAWALMAVGVAVGIVRMCIIRMQPKTAILHVHSGREVAH